MHACRYPVYMQLAEGSCDPALLGDKGHAGAGPLPHVGAKYIHYALTHIAGPWEDRGHIHSEIVPAWGTGGPHHPFTHYN